MRNLLAKLRMSEKFVLLVVTSIVLTALSVWGIFNSVMQEIYERKITRISEETLTQVGNYFNNELIHILQLAHGGLIGYDVAETVHQDRSNLQNPLVIAHIEQMLTQFKVQNSLIESAHLVYQGRKISNLNNRTQYDMTPVLEQAVQVPLIYWHNTAISAESSGKKIIPVVIKIPTRSQMNTSGGEGCMLILDLSYDELCNTLRQMESNMFGQVLLLNDEGQSFDGETPITMAGTQWEQTVQLDVNHWNIWAIQQKNVLLQEFYQAQFQVVGLLLVIVAGFILVAKFLAQSITRPLKRLKEMSVKMQARDYSQKMPVAGIDEIAELSTAFNQLEEKLAEYSEIVERDKEIIREEETAKRKIEMRLLQAQINPHFLYNTMDSMYWYAMGQKTEAVGELILNLSTLFRISLSNGTEVVSLARELQHVESYLKIQKIIFGQKFTYQIQCDNTVQNYHVIKLLLQPLVENSILHGFSDVELGGEIEINLFTSGDELVMQVLDNGCGFLDTQTKNSSDVGGFALRNIRQRLALHYGSNASLAFGRTWNGMTKVEIHIMKKDLL